MSRVLGLSVTAGAVHAVLADARRVWWAGSAAYEGIGDLAEVIARLAAEAGGRTRRVRVALERDLVQLRTILPAPPIKRGAVARYVALEAPRLFRRNGAPLVTDACLIRLTVVSQPHWGIPKWAKMGIVGLLPGVLKPRRTNKDRALWAAAAQEPLLEAIADGCAQAGFALEALAPAAEVLPRALAEPNESGVVVFANGETSEAVEIHRGIAWRSRAVRSGEHPCPAWAKPLAGLGEDARRFAAAYGAARSRPRLLLLPPRTREAGARKARASVRRLFVSGLVAWTLAAGAYVTRMMVASGRVERELAAIGPVVDRALAVRRDLGAATEALTSIDTARRGRSRSLALLGDLAAALDDSTIVVHLRVSPDSTLRLAGYAPAASRVLAELERVQLVRGARLEAPTTRETITWNGAPREWDRFAIVARLAHVP